MNLDFILEILKNPFVVISLATIVLAIIITQQNLVGKWLRKVLKLSTDKETVEFVKKITNTRKTEEQIRFLLRKV